jgi:hypothetical protein
MISQIFSWKLVVLQAISIVMFSRDERGSRSIAVLERFGLMVTREELLRD